MIAVRFARRALGELDRLEGWCAANAPGFWPLVVAELARAVRLLRAAPEIGPVYDAHRKPGVRRLLLGGTQLHAYYRHHPTKSLVVVLSIWSGRRGRTPSFR